MSQKVSADDILDTAPAAGPNPDKKRTRLPDEERTRRAAERAEAARARAAKLNRIAADARALAQTFERRAEALAARPAPPETASLRKSLRKVLRAATTADAKTEAEIARVRAAGGEPVDRGTGLTRVKLAATPMARLIEARKIGAEEVSAADEIALAFAALSGGAGSRSMTFDRVDKSVGAHDFLPAATMHAVSRYRAWADHWTVRANLYGDMLLEIVIAAVIDERPLRTIAYDCGIGPGRAQDATVLGLRDYAARGGLVSRGVGAPWIAAAEALFVPANTALQDAIRRARIER